MFISPLVVYSIEDRYNVYTNIITIFILYPIYKYPYAYIYKMTKLLFFYQKIIILTYLRSMIDYEDENNYGMM